MKVTIILTSYNHDKFLRESIDSVLNQTYTDFELIIVDDCSQDSSWDIICEYTDPRIIKIRNPQNLRTEGYYNALMNIASGEYFAMHHSDDVWEPDKLQKQVDFLKEHSEIAAVFTYVKVIDENSDAYEDQDGFYYKLFDQPNRTRHEWLNYFFYFGNCLCHPSVLMRRRLVVEEEMFDFGLAQIPDLSRWVRICIKHNIYIIPERLTCFRIQNDGRNTSGNRPDTIIRSSIELFHFLKLYLQIQDQDDFLKVFPDAEEFATGEQFIGNYSLARVCIRPEMNSYTRLFGYELLYDLMNDHRIAKIVEKQYGYTFRDLIKETGSNDIFHVLPENSNQTATIYYDLGKGFNEKDIFRTNYFLKDHYVFDQKFEINPDDLKNNKIVKLRFDPSEGIFCRCKDVKMHINGQEFCLYPYNALPGEYQETIFMNRDPIFISDDIEISTQYIKITGTIKRITENEVEKLFAEVQSKSHCCQNELCETKDKLRAVENELKRRKRFKSVNALYRYLNRK